MRRCRPGVHALLLGCCAACAAALQPAWLPRRAMAARSPIMLTASEGIDLADTPAGAPDPYRLVHDDLDYIKRSIKKMLTSQKGETGALTSNGVLTMAAREFMGRKGKSFRPMLVLLIGRATGPDFVTDKRHSKLAVISEMIHTASLIHADVLEEYETDTSQGTLVHQEVALEVGNKVCILAGDFLLAKAAVELSLLEDSAVTVRSTRHRRPASRLLAASHLPPPRPALAHASPQVRSKDAHGRRRAFAHARRREVSAVRRRLAARAGDRRSRPGGDLRGWHARLQQR